MRSFIEKGQAFVDYVILIVAITGALYTMQVFLRRAIQAKIKDTLVAMGMGNQEVDTQNLTVNDVYSVSDQLDSYSRVMKVDVGKNDIKVEENEETVEVILY